MAKYSGPLQEVARALDLVPFLATHSYISIAELASEFGVSEKEIVAELTALTMCGLPGYTAYELIDISFDSGFVTIRNHEPLNLSRALSKMEITSLLIGLELLRESVASPSDSLSIKISSLIEKLKAYVSIPVSADPLPYSQERKLIDRAIAAGALIEFSYLSVARDSTSSRVVSPQVMREESAHTYLDGFCMHAQGNRSFRLDRIQDLRISSSSDEVLTPLSTSEGNEELRARVAVHARMRRHRENLSLTNISERGEADLMTFSQSWIERALLAASPDIEVISPVELRTNLARQAEAILELYQAQ